MFMNHDDGLRIRAFDPIRDAAAIRRCFVDLQNHEHAYSPHSPIGEELASEYVPFMIERAMQPGNAFLVAELAGAVIGFATALRTASAEPDDTDPFHFELAELSVVTEQQNKGVGTALIDAVARHARSHGAPNLRVRVDIANSDAQRLYRRIGFEPAVAMLVMPLTSDGRW
jgi:GNAT superfamily N-acetyltransferase